MGKFQFSFLLGRSCLDYRAQETKSSLSKTLEQVLRDSVALPYFIQFMELRRMEHLVRFWLEAESFHSTTWSRIRAHSLNTVKHSSLAEPVSPSIRQHENAASSPSELLDERLEGSGSDGSFSSTPSAAELNGRTCSLRNRLLLRPGGSKPHCGFGTSEAEDCSIPDEPQDSSKASMPSRNSPSFALKDLSGKLMKGKG